MNEVKLFECKSYDENIVREAMNKIIASFDVLKEIRSGTRVVIKANLVSAMSPEKSVTTHPVLLKTLTSYLLNKGCSVVIGDSPSGLFNKASLSHIYKVTKMNETGAVLNDNFQIKKVVSNSSVVLKSFEYTKYLDDADIKINFCKLKTHGMMNMSCSVKNLFGVIPGTIKQEYHYRFPNLVDFANMLIDLNEYFNFDLNIVDAVDGMEGNGPTMGDSRHIGLLLASKKPYALDYVCAQIIGFSSDMVETINQSIKRNLFNPNDININDDIKKYIILDYKKNSTLKSLSFFSDSKGIKRLIGKTANKIFDNKPMCNKSKCIGCQKCFNICPAKAISMVNSKPVIDRSKCIKCYCCQEFCPVGAMRVKTSVTAKLIRNKH